ncbi:MAG: DUF2867 domain-containing protein [Candidatus Eremiobacteraeota bacterium]|nr:DUF2867 domain-containing protein [Candidatus Eremiobacteraeota bacterium]
MPQIATHELRQIPLRVHNFLADVPLHDVWAIDLARKRPGLTLDAFLGATSSHLFTPSPVVRRLLRIRFFFGHVFGWDREDGASTRESFASRLTGEDRARSLAATGANDGPFRVVYRFENEQLSEIVNGTAHAAMLSALVETDGSYRFYLAVYVRRVSLLTPLYMAAIDPFRKLIVYPSLLQNVRTSWDRTLS